MPYIKLVVSSLLNCGTVSVPRPSSLLLIPRIEFVGLVGRVAHPDAREQKESGRVSRVLPG